MDIPEDPYESKRENTNSSVERSESPAAEVTLAGRWPDTPIDAIEESASIPIPADFLRKNNIYVLQVKGDSMIEDHLLGGDHLIVEKRNTARDGEMVVALTNKGAATLKRFFREGPWIRLEPADASTEAMLLDEKDVAIQGVVLGILRKYRG